jgi:hypothetical protein
MISICILCHGAYSFCPQAGEDLVMVNESVQRENATAYSSWSEKVLFILPHGISFSRSAGRNVKRFSWDVTYIDVRKWLKTHPSRTRLETTSRRFDLNVMIQC